MLPARSEPCPPRGDTRRRHRRRLGKQGEAGSGESSGQQADRLRAVQPGPRRPGICLVPPPREATFRSASAAAAGLPGLPRAAGHLSATLESAGSGRAAPDPGRGGGSLLRPSTNPGPEKLFVSACAYGQSFEATGKDHRIVCRRKSDRIWPFPAPVLPHVCPLCRERSAEPRW